MELKYKYIILVCLVIAVLSPLSDGKRSLSGRSRTSSSGSRGSSTRRVTQTHYSPPPVSKPSSTSVHHAPNADHVKLTHGGVNSQPTQNKPASYGWNVPNQQNSAVNKPPLNAGPPPAYSPHNVPGGAKTNIHEPPPAYKPNNAAPPSYPGNNQPVGGASYPKQTYNTQSGSGYPHGTGAAAGAHPVSHNTGGVHSPIYAHTVRPIAAGAGGSYHPTGSIQPGFYPHQTGASQSYHPPPPPPGGFPAGVHPVGGGGFYPQQYPQQASPVFAGSGVQPGFYPAGSFPGRSSSGPGLGTGLIAGALGGAILGHALTPTHTHHVVSGGTSNAPADNQDRIIVINNNPGQPATVTNAAGQPVSGVSVIQNGGQPATGVTSGGVPEPPVPLAPFPNQQNAQPGQPAGQLAGQPAGQPQPFSAGTATSGAAYPDGVVPLAPFPNANSNSTEQSIPPATNVNGTTQPQYATYCMPVMVNVTDPNNTANVTTVEQVYCYNVLVPPPEQQMAPATNSSQSQPDLMYMPGNYNPNPSNDITNYPTQKTSTASLAANSNIKNGCKGIYVGTGSKSVFDTIFMTLITFLAAYCMH